MFDLLEDICARPRPHQFMTAELLWTDPWVSGRMLAFHLDGSVDVSSRNEAFMDRSASWMARRFGLDAGLAVGDFGCGPGLYARRLTDLGATVTGLDFSPRSIEHARRQAAASGRDIRYVLLNYLDFAERDCFDLILLIFCDYCALSPEQRVRLLEVFRRALKPGGRLLMDVFSTAWFAGTREGLRFERLDGEGFWSSEPHYVFADTFRYPAQSLYLDKYTIVERGRTRRVYNWLQCFSPESLTRELAAGGFRVLETHANVAGDPLTADSPELAVVAAPR